MKNRRCLLFAPVLVLAGMLLLAGTGWAQNQGGGGPAKAQSGQLCTGGPNGTCLVTPPKTPAPQNCPGYGAGKGQRQRGPKGQGRGGNQSNTQANPPAPGK